MDQPKVGVETFTLKTNIHCHGCEKKIRKLLQDIRGVDKFSIDAEQGRITISGTIDPQTLVKLLWKNGKKSELLWEPMVADQNDLQIDQSLKSQVNKHHVIDDTDVVQLQKLSEIKGLKTVEVTGNGMKITFKDGENVQNFAAKYDYSAARSMDRRAMHKKVYNGDHYVMDNDSDFYDNHHCCCSNQAMHTQYNHGCPPRNCNCTASHGNISLGIPLPGYTPSAPPVPEYYGNPPPQERSYDHLFYSAFIEDNPSGCVIM